jgi:hypothetical protein
MPRRVTALNWRWLAEVRIIQSDRPLLEISIVTIASINVAIRLKYSGQTAGESNRSEHTAEELKQDAIGRAWGHSDDGWRKNALRAVRLLCESKKTFTADDLDAVMRQTKEPRIIGSLLIHAKKRGWCKPTGNYRQSELPRRDQPPVMIWESLLHPPV